MKADYLFASGGLSGLSGVFFWLALLVFASFWPDFFWLAFGDLSPIAFIFWFGGLTGLRHGIFSGGDRMVRDGRRL